MMGRRRAHGPGTARRSPSYASQLKSVTGGQGSYMMELSHYDVVPPNVQQQIVAQYKTKEEEEE